MKLKGKRILSLTLAALVVSASCALAAPDAGKKIYQIVEHANKKVQDVIHAAQKTKKMDAYEAEAKANAYCEAARLQVEAMGGTLSCTYVSHEVDGVTIWVDPLYVINVPEL